MFVVLLELVRRQSGRREVQDEENQYFRSRAMTNNYLSEPSITNFSNIH